MRKIRVLLADDHAVLRGGLRLMLNGQPDMEVVGEAGNGLDTVSMTAELQPDVILLDLSMPLLDGLGVIEKLQDVANAAKILVLTMHDDEGYLQKVLTRGARGYILKRAADADLLAAIRAVDGGNVYIEPSMVGALVKMAMKPPAPDPVRTDLSDREKDVLRLVAMGFTNRQIADKLVISIKTVETHRSNIKDKLGIKGRADLVRYALQHKLINELSPSSG